MFKYVPRPFALVVLVLAGCGGGGGDEGGGPANQAPTANAGADQTVSVGATVALNGAGSSDPDGDALTYQWAFVSRPAGSAAALSSATAAAPTFVADRAGTYLISLTVRDPDDASATDQVSITANAVNRAPTANAGADRTVSVGQAASLDGSASSDPDGDPLTYQWTFTSRPAGSAAALTGATAVAPSFTPDVAGAYVISLTVNDGALSSAADSVTVTAEDCATSSDTLFCSWIINDTSKRSAFIFESDTSSTRALIDVQSVTEVTVNGQDYVRVQASGVPDYEVAMTADMIAELNARPKAATDFVTGSTNATVGEIISFGEDIGYRSNMSCRAGGGRGYWPPGPVCPEDVDHDGFFTRDPQPGTTACETGLGTIGFMVNGASIFNHGDGQSYNNQDTWHTLAPFAEVYDVDICGGHAANGEYHHHFHSQCLADLIGDTGSGHSPVYGFAADGYPVHGPWHANGVLAVSSWRIRDYANPASATGCGSAGARTCQMRDATNPALGTQPVANAGPTTSGSYTSLSGNTFTTVAGFFLEDYYWDSALTALGGANLDEHNGHEHDGLGYHYHITVTDDGSGDLTPSFPFNIGPEFRGELPDDNNMTACGGLGPTPP
jgi:hypothetical protein